MRMIQYFFQATLQNGNNLFLSIAVLSFWICWFRSLSSHNDTLSLSDCLVSSSCPVLHLFTCIHNVCIVPNAPQRFSGETQGTTTIALTWMAPDSTNNATFDKYEITYTPSGGNDDTKEVTANTTTLTGLSPGVLYTIRLVAVSHQPDETVSAEASGGPLTVRTSEFFRLYSTAETSLQLTNMATGSKV